MLFRSAMREGIVIGTATPIHLGISTQVWQINITDERERLVCTSRLTVAVQKIRNRSQAIKVDL